MGSQKSDKIGTFLTSPEGDIVRGAREPAPYVFRVLTAWAAGALGAPPTVRFLEPTPTRSEVRLKLFLPLLGRNRLIRDGPPLWVEPGTLGVVLRGEGHGEEWEPDPAGRYLHVFVGLPPGRLSINLGRGGDIPGLPAGPRILAGASLAHSEISLLERMLLYLRRHPGASPRLAPALVEVMRTAVSFHHLRGESPLVQRAIDRLMENPCHPQMSVAWMADRLGCHPDTLSRRFRAETGTAFLSAVRDVRMQIAADLLAGGNLPVGEVAGLCGYHDHSYFTRVFKRIHGAAPSTHHGPNR